MDWTSPIDAYCERTDASYWSEPINAVTNLAFVLGAAWVWRHAAGVPLARGLCCILALIGLGSWLFHTHATRWAAVADVAPIAAYVLTYIFAINRNVLALRRWHAVFATALFLPYAALTVPLWREVPVLGVSAAYMPVPTLIVIYALGLRRRAPVLARGFGVGAAILLASLLARSLDGALCDVLPLGTHFMWHLLNAVMLTWMIHVYTDHVRRA